MQTPRFQNPINFKGATININALSDTHGHLELADGAHQALENLKDDVFEKEDIGKQNYFIIGGDWYMSGDTRGFLSKPDKPLIWFQNEMLKRFMEKIKGFAPKTKFLFTPGNHDLDSGIKLFKDTIKDFHGQILMTNLDFQNSPEFKSLIEKGKLVASQIDFVKDDKNKDKTHAVLNLGISPVNMNYYGNTDGITLIDNSKISQKDISQQFYKKTLDTTKEKIDNFKAEYPDGTVILTCHTGVGFADACAKLGKIDLILDGHEHKDEIRVINSTPIVALSQNFRKIVNAKIDIDDTGKNKQIKFTDIRPVPPKKEGPLNIEYQMLFEEDSKNIYTLKCENSKITKLDIDGVRTKNNHLANFVCDILLNSVREKDPTVQIFALNSSSIRGGFKLGKNPQTSMFDVINCLSGINRSQADIYTNEVTGEELAELIKDNLNFNKIDPERNSIIQYSGISINKTKFMKAKENANLADLCQYITLEETGETIDPEKTYKIANPEKYFIKTKNNKIRNMLTLASPLNLNARDAFCDYFKEHPNITFTTKQRFH